MGVGPLLVDRVLETSTTTGTGTLTLAGAVTGYQSFAAVGDGNSCFYCVMDVDANGNASGSWEVGVGTYTLSGTTLSRTTVLASSNSGSLVSFAAGTKRVFVCNPASFAAQYLNPTAAYASLAAAQAGRLGFPSDGVTLLRDTGGALAPWGPIYPFTDPTAAGLSTWDNQGSATVANVSGAVYLTAPTNGGGNSARVRYKTAPSTPYTITVAYLLHAALVGGGNSVTYGSGPCFRQSSTGKLIGWGLGFSTASAAFWHLDRYTSATVFGAGAQASNVFDWYSPVWARINDDGTNLKYSVSADGQNWIQLASESRTAFMAGGPDQVGIYTDPYNAAVGLTLLSWKQT